MSSTPGKAAGAGFIAQSLSRWDWFAYCASARCRAAMEAYGRTVSDRTRILVGSRFTYINVAIFSVSGPRSRQTNALGKNTQP